MKKLSCLIALLLAFSMLLCLRAVTEAAASSNDMSSGIIKANSPAATEPEPAEEPSFVEHQSYNPRSISGRRHCHTDADETVDLTGIPLSGRKEIILNGHALTLTGAYGVSPDAVLDIKPGEAEAGTINLNELTFDFGFLSEELPPEKALVEIRHEEDCDDRRRAAIS